MSATNQNLLEQIQRVEKALEECKVTGDHSMIAKLSEVLDDLHKKFASQSQALNEGRSILKG